MATLYRDENYGALVVTSEGRQGLKVQDFGFEGLDHVHAILEECGASSADGVSWGGPLSAKTLGIRVRRTLESRGYQSEDRFEARSAREIPDAQSDSPDLPVRESCYVPTVVEQHIRARVKAALDHLRSCGEVSVVETAFFKRPYATRSRVPFVRVRGFLRRAVEKPYGVRADVIAEMRECGPERVTFQQITPGEYAFEFGLVVPVPTYEAMLISAPIVDAQAHGVRVVRFAANIALSEQDAERLGRDTGGVGIVTVVESGGRLISAKVPCANVDARADWRFSERLRWLQGRLSRFGAGLIDMGVKVELL